MAGLNQTPGGLRTQIGIFGRTNTGKSSVLNMLTGQEAAIVSDVAGTTTDPVKKSMELGALGPCLIIDTPGTYDRTALEAKRQRSMERVMAS
ncbi:MAG: 50S ribosome-binding GTPase, partial [Lachnospiraceae bacterium]|nr:50S ribosome-binding GTPase [Lachnospiraceae bacterium]